MVRIAFDIDEKTKREIKIRLAEESRTLSEVMRTFCSHYKDFGLYPGQQIRWEDRGTLPDTPAVYFIYANGEVQYVGQTISLCTRFGGHHRSHQFAELGASIFWVGAPTDILMELESWFIEALEPPLNGSEILDSDQPARKRCIISLSEEDMDRLDSIARETHRSRSGMIGYLLSLIRLGKGGAVEIDEGGTGHEESES